MPGDRRAGAAEHAEHVNAAAGLLEAGVPAAEAARVLAGRLGCSERQARRYVSQAAASGRIPVPEEGTVFTVGCLPLDRFRRWFLERPPVVIVSNWR